MKANVGEGSITPWIEWPAVQRRAQFVLLCSVQRPSASTPIPWRSSGPLSNDDAVRAAVVAAAENYARETLGRSNDAVRTAPLSPAADVPANPEPATNPASALRSNVETVVAQLDGLGLPVGWRYYDPAIDDAALRGSTRERRRSYLVEQRIWPQLTGDWLWEWWAQLASHLLGWLFTAFALSFGAPFWFDVLNKIMVVRSTVKPHEKSREEGSEDRQPRANDQTVRVEVAPAK